MKEILIIADENNSNGKGKFYEDLMNSVFKSQRYKVEGNVNFTGMEFDLLCKHLDRDDEIILVECKVKDSLSSDELTKFAFNVQHKKLSYGYFLYTKSYVHQISGLITELKNDQEKRYKNLYFWDGEKIIELLVDSGLVKPLDFKNTKYRITKTILLYSYIGTFYLAILSDSTLPNAFTIFEANTLEQVTGDRKIDIIKEMVKEVQSLQYYHDKNEIVISNTRKVQLVTVLETVAEIQSSDSWDDFKPASSKYFVGRKVIESEIMNWLLNVLAGDNAKRIFYLDGKSGWGKSSLLNAIKGRTKNKFHKTKIYTYVVDSRSANSQNFIPLAFTKLIEKAINDSFLPKSFSNIKIESIYNILQSKEVLELLQYLNVHNKLIVIIFDQFEDIFRKANIFDGFYKLLIDTVNVQSNFVVGFSWKSEVNIPIDHNAYFLWQQMKDFAFSFTLNEFELSESRKIVAQLETSISHKLDSDFVRKIVDNTQGFPWLVKKLCIHIFNQYRKGIALDNLYDQDFNVEVLFKEDCENLSTDELKALKHIALKAYENEMIDEIDIYDSIDSKVKDSLLLNKKLIIKSGTKYNIYWDIFRDYLVTGDVPKVGETYILRHNPAPVYDLLSVFSNRSRMKIEQILKLNNLPKAENTTGNILRELRALGIIIYKDGEYYLRENDFDLSENGFKLFIKDKIFKHSFYIALSKITDKAIDIDDITLIIKEKIKSQVFSKKTLEIYAQIFWLFSQVST
jgi:predicted transcriptional regulator